MCSIIFFLFFWNFLNKTEKRISRIQKIEQLAKWFELKRKMVSHSTCCIFHRSILKIEKRIFIELYPERYVI